MTYAQNTDVSVEKSRSELERTLQKYGATHFAYATTPDRAAVQFLANGKAIRFELPLPNPSEKRFTHWQRGRFDVARDPACARSLWEQACRVSWRALNLVVKAKLEAVESGITSFEEEFLAHIVMPNGQTFGTYALPEVNRSLETCSMPPLLLN